MTDRRWVPLQRHAMLAAAMVLAITLVGSGQGPAGPPNSPVDATANGPSDAAATPEEVAATIQTMQNWVKTKFKIDDVDKHFKPHELVKDKRGVWHGSLDQFANDIRVRGAHVNVTIENGAVDEARTHGEYFDDADAVDPKPKIGRGLAIQIVEAALRGEVQRRGGRPKPAGAPDRSLLVADENRRSNATLEIHPGGGRGKRKLTYHVSAEDHSAEGPLQIEAWVDQDGEIVEAYNNIQTTHCQAGLGRTFYQGNQGSGWGSNYFNIAWWFTNGVYVLNDNCQRFGTFDMYGGTSATYQASVSDCCGPTFGNNTLANRNSTNADTLWSSIQSYSFMYWVLGRNFVDGAGGPRVYSSVDGNGPLVSARNHYGVNYNNAFWDGQKINLGDGDGTSFRSFATLDIVGHEWVHGLTQYTAGLIYSGESGALNEAFSDILGAMAERYWYGESTAATGLNTWKIGELAYTPTNGTGDALRYMNAPWLGGQPWHYSQRYTGTGDNGGVHINSGIANFAFYLLAKGGCGSVCVTGIGADAATQIFYRALRYYMIPTDGFYWARRTTQWAAWDLYGLGSPQYNATVAAWNAVGAP